MAALLQYWCSNYKLSNTVMSLRYREAEAT